MKKKLLTKINLTNYNSCMNLNLFLLQKYYGKIIRTG